MLDKITVVDAVSVPAGKSLPQNVSLPIDAAQIGKAIQEAAAKAMAASGAPGVEIQKPEQIERINPSIFMRDMSVEMEKLYQRFETLKLLAAELNGRGTDEPLPQQVIFKGLTLDFAISKNDSVTEHSVKMQAVSCIGDISNLMSNEFGYIIASLRELSKQVAELAQKTNERCTSALSEWEAANKNKQVTATADNPSQLTPPAVSEKPITLETQ